MPLDTDNLVFERFAKSRFLWQRQKELLLSSSGRLDMSVSIAKYDNAFDILVHECSSAGTVAIGLGEADFYLDRYVDPIADITVVSSPDMADRLISVAIAALNKIAEPFAVTFDTGSYVSIVSAGNVLGYSDWEELERYGFPPDFSSLHAP